MSGRKARQGEPNHLFYVKVNYGTAQFQLETVYRLQQALPPSLK